MSLMLAFYPYPVRLSNHVPARHLRKRGLDCELRRRACRIGGPDSIADDKDIEIFSETLKVADCSLFCGIIFPRFLRSI